MKKFLSYFWPITKRYTSPFNGTLEVTWIDGKKLLDSKNANYSYGLLQEILEFGLLQIDLKNIQNILILGMGGGSIIQSLRNKFQFYGNIVAVEIDPEIIKIAEREFGVRASETLQIIEEDAFEFTKKSSGIFQLIVIDIFKDNRVPPIFYGKEFIKNIERITQNGGIVIFNVGFNFEKEDDTIQEIIKYFGTNHNFKIHKKVLGINTILQVQKNRE